MSQRKPRQRPLTQKLTAWFRHHGEALRTGVGYVISTPLTSLLLVLAMSVALTLPAALYLGVTSLFVGERSSSSGTINAFAELALEDAALTQLAEQIRIRPDVQSVQLLNRDQVWQEFSKNNDIKEILGSLSDNPLPATLLIQVKPNAANPAATSAIANEIRNLEGIAEANVDVEWLERVAALGKSLKTISQAFGFGLISLLVLIFHIALRSEILVRKEEIEVLKLIGANNEYIERPFIYFAITYGVLAALLALLWLLLAFAYLQPAIDAIPANGEGVTQLGIPAAFGFGLVLNVVILAAITALLTVRTISHKMEPR